MASSGTYSAVAINAPQWCQATTNFAYTNAKVIVKLKCPGLLSFRASESSHPRRLVNIDLAPQLLASQKGA
jgi:hypothetical protein